MKKRSKLIFGIIVILSLLIAFSCSDDESSSTKPNIVATPTFSPSSGTYDAPIQVTIECSTSEAMIRYTMDGSEPTETSMLYSSQLDISQTTTIKAKAYKENCSPSGIAIASYVIEVNPNPDMVFVPGGTFIMGRTRGDGLADELPTHQVTLSPFYIGKYEVTQAEYQALMDSNPSYSIGSDKPVERVVWIHSVEYCNAKSIQEGLTPCYNTTNWTCDFTANGYRLPTEAEWEYAARGASNEPDYLYSGSDDINSVAWCTFNSGSTTHNVGSKMPNSLGIYDMSGNVCEWCNDFLGDYSSDAQTDPVGPDSSFYRILRGGSWDYSAEECRVAIRFAYNQAYANGNMGFRLVRRPN